ncbi:uncharacterized protein LOC105395813 [Plutella xylostella]|uniref:uncharacterized protein LOC105395813 n=1 Tax=Plutella xylostella TaxID=51655 RepID=UPI002032F325|nr:uncharacterized protein LOC105395813 [Plutella xylostella]
MYDGQMSNQSSPSSPGAPPQPVVRLDRKHLRTPSGMCQMVQLTCNILGFICLKVAWGAWVSAIFYNLIFWIGILVTGAIFTSYLFHVVEKFDAWPWHKFEFLYCAAMALGYIITSIFAMTIGESVGYAVGFFGFFAIIAYSGDSYLKYQAWKRGLPAQSPQ